MAQIQQGETFADGELVTADRLNDIAGNATVLSGIITEQNGQTDDLDPNMLGTPVPVSVNDRVLIWNQGAAQLRQTTFDNIFQSNLDVGTQLVEGDNLVLRQITGAITVGNPLIGMGAYPNHDVYISGNTFIDGNYTEINNLLKVTGDLDVSLDTTLSGSLSVATTASVTGNATVGGNLTVTGTIAASNLRDTQVFTKNIEFTPSNWNALGVGDAIYTTPAPIQVPSGERWYYILNLSIAFANQDVADNTRPEWAGDIKAVIGSTEVDLQSVWVNPYGGNATVNFAVPVTTADTTVAKDIYFKWYPNPEGSYMYGKIQPTSKAGAWGYVQLAIEKTASATFKNASL